MRRITLSVQAVAWGLAVTAAPLSAQSSSAQSSSAQSSSGRSGELNQGPRAAECEGTAKLVASTTGRGVTRTYGPRYFIDLPKVQDRYNGVTVFCAAGGSALDDQIEIYAANSATMDRMLPMIGSMAASMSKEALDRSTRAAASCLSKTRQTRDSEEFASGKLVVSCRMTTSGQELQIRKRP
jgi:hypothetical protein